MRSTVAHKMIALVALLIGIPAYIYGCVRAVQWALVHMWVQRGGWYACATKFDGLRHIVCRATWYGNNAYWGAVLMSILLASFTGLVIFVAVKETP